MSTLISILSISLIVFMVIAFIIGIYGVYYGVKNSEKNIVVLSCVPIIISLAISTYIGYYKYIDLITIKTSQTVKAQVIKKEYSKEGYIIILKYGNIEDKVCDVLLYNKVNEGQELDAILLQEKVKNKIVYERLYSN